MVNDFYAPYAVGDTCAQCPDRCKNNLCGEYFQENNA